MTSIRYSLAAMLALAALASSTPAPANAADPFYTRLLERGVRDLELGLTDDATARLRTACFGLLEEPLLLAECLMQLGRAQARTGNIEDLTTTAERLAELEDRFGSYSAFAGDLKSVFEGALRNALPQAWLSRMPAFSHLAQAPPRETPSTAALTPKRRRKALEKRLLENPADGDAQLSLARLHYANGKLQPAGALLDRLLASQPDNQEALCLRAQIAVARTQCAPALDGLNTCPGLTSGNKDAAFVLECLALSGRTGDALALLRSMPAEQAQSTPVARVAKRIARTAEAGETRAAPGQAPAVTTESTASSDRAEQERNDLLERRLEEIRQQAAGSKYREELAAALSSAAELADEYPDSAKAQYLTAEIAYLGAEWQLALDYFERGGGTSGSRPVLLFYAAVAHYELGDRVRAAQIVQGALASLPRSSFVDDYLEKILTPDSP